MVRESLGIVETVGISTAIEVADVMVKAANVKILELENSRGGGYMTTKIVGDVGAVKAAISAAKAEGMKYGNLVSASVIARPSDGMASLFCNPKVPYQSVNKKPVSYGVEDKEQYKTAKKDEPKKATQKKAVPAKKVVSTKKVTATKQKPAIKSEDVKAEAKKAEVAKVATKKVEPAKKVEVKKEVAKKVEVKKVEAKKPEPKKETPKVAPKTKQKTSDTNKNKK